MLQPTLPFLRPKFSLQFKKERKKERKKYLCGRPTDGRKDGPTDAHGQAAISMSPPFLPSRIIAGPAALLRQHTPPTTFLHTAKCRRGPVANRLHRSRYLTTLCLEQQFYWMYGHHQTVVTVVFNFEGK